MKLTSLVLALGVTPATAFALPSGFTGLAQSGGDLNDIVAAPAMLRPMNIPLTSQPTPLRVIANLRCVGLKTKGGMPQWDEPIDYVRHGRVAMTLLLHKTGVSQTKDVQIELPNTFFSSDARWKGYVPSLPFSTHKNQNPLANDDNALDHWITEYKADIPNPVVTKMSYRKRLLMVELMMPGINPVTVNADGTYDIGDLDRVAGVQFKNVRYNRKSGKRTKHTRMVGPDQNDINVGTYRLQYEYRVDHTLLIDASLYGSDDDCEENPNVDIDP